MRTAVLACAALLACGRGPATVGGAGAGESSGAGPARRGLPRPAFLRRVPADTPYAFAALAPMPRGYFEGEYLARVSAYQPLAEAFARLRRDKPDRFARLTVAHRLTAGLLAELAGRRAADAMAAVGLDRSPRWILYGAGASPVVRIELRDRARAAAALDRVLTYLAPVAERALAGVRYRSVDDGARRWVFALVEGDLVVAMLSRDRFDAELATALAIQPPAENLAEARTLEQVAGEVGAAPYSLGYIDTVRLAGQLAAGLPAACRDELAGLAGLAPRVAFGVRAASARQVQMVSLVELRRDVAAALDGVRGELPGPDPESAASASLSIGLAVDVAQATSLLDDAFERVVAHPYACSSLDWLNRLARGQGSSLGWVAASPFGKVDGVSAFIFAGDPPAPGASGVPRTPTGGVLLLGAEQPAALLQSVAGLLPIGLPTTLKAGDAPVVVGGGVGLPLSPIHVALGKRALGFAAGGHEAELSELVAATPMSDPPLFYFAMRARELAALIGASRTAPPDPALAEIDPELAARLADIESKSLDRFDELTLRATPTARGLELFVDARYTP